MARPVQIRADGYRDDAAFLLRLEEAIGKDDRQTSEWRRVTCDKIRELVNRLLEAGKLSAFSDLRPNHRKAVSKS